MGFSRQKYWSGLPCSRPVDLSDPGIEPSSALAGRLFTTNATWEATEHSGQGQNQSQTPVLGLDPSSIPYKPRQFKILPNWNCLRFFIRKMGIIRVPVGRVMVVSTKHLEQCLMARVQSASTVNSYRSTCQPPGALLSQTHLIPLHSHQICRLLLLQNADSHSDTGSIAASLAGDNQKLQGSSGRLAFH